MYGLIIGVDCGTNGAITYVKLKDGKPMAHPTVVKMPKDFKALNRYLREITDGMDRCICFIEKVWLNPGDMIGGKAFNMQKLVKNYNEICNALDANDIGYIDVPARTWQNDLNLRLSKEEAKKESDTMRKNRYKRVAQVYFKTITCTLWNSDALLILYFGLKKLNYDKPYIMDNLPAQDLDLLF